MVMQSTTQAIEKLEAMLNLLSRLGITVEREDFYYDMGEKECSILADLISNVFLSPILLLELFKYATQPTVCVGSVERLSGYVELLDNKHKPNFVLEIKCDVSEAPKINVLVRNPVPLTLFPVPRVLLLSVLKERASLLETAYDEPPFKYKLAFIQREEFEEYLQALQKLRRFWPLIPIIRQLIDQWARSREVKIVKPRGWNVALVEVAKFPRSGNIVWIVRRRTSTVSSKL